MRAALPIIGATLLASCSIAFGQMQDNHNKDLTCNERRSSRDAERSFCEVRESTAPVMSRLAIDPGTNGGVSVKGWERNEVLVRSKVEARGDDEQDARIIASQVRVIADAGRIRADGPQLRDRRSWSVSLEIFLPHRTDLEIKAINGGIHLQDLEGDLGFQAMNGGVHMARLAGRVHGHTTNGGIHLELAGPQWNGTEVDVTTTNGGVHVDLPANYSARLEMSTSNGGLDVDAPGVTIPRDAKEFRGTIGSGGPLIRAVTTNGGVKIGRKRG